MARYNMNNLSQQLEDKKKEYKQLYNSNHENFPNSNVCRTCAKMNRCQAEIAILEQAIAEIKKQRQDEIEFLENLNREACAQEFNRRSTEQFYKFLFLNTNNRVTKLKSQLNQPKRNNDKS